MVFLPPCGVPSGQGVPLAVGMAPGVASGQAVGLASGVASCAIPTDVMVLKRIVANRAVNATMTKRNGREPPSSLIRCLHSGVRCCPFGFNLLGPLHSQRCVPSRPLIQNESAVPLRVTPPSTSIPTSVGSPAGSPRSSATMSSRISRSLLMGVTVSLTPCSMSSTHVWHGRPRDGLCFDVLFSPARWKSTAQRSRVVRCPWRREGRPRVPVQAKCLMLALAGARHSDPGGSAAIGAGVGELGHRGCGRS